MWPIATDVASIVHGHTTSSARCLNRLWAECCRLKEPCIGWGAHRPHAMEPFTLDTCWFRRKVCERIAADLSPSRPQYIYLSSDWVENSIVVVSRTHWGGVAEGSARARWLPWPPWSGALVTDGDVSPPLPASGAAAVTLGVSGHATERHLWLTFSLHAPRRGYCDQVGTRRVDFYVW